MSIFGTISFDQIIFAIIVTIVLHEALAPFLPNLRPQKQEQSSRPHGKH